MYRAVLETAKNDFRAHPWKDLQDVAVDACLHHSISHEAFSFVPMLVGDLEIWIEEGMPKDE